MMTSYGKQENGQGWTGSGTMETTIRCDGGLVVPLTRVRGRKWAAVASVIDTHK